MLLIGVQNTSTQAVVVDGIIRDLWDCSDCYADIVWKVA